MYGPLRAIRAAIADGINDFGGLVMTRLRRDLPPATFGTTPPAEAYEALVESTYRFPATGRIIAHGEVMPYVSKTETTLVDLTRDNAVRQTYRRGDAVALWTRDVSALDNARLSMLCNTAEGAFLDVVGQNYGVPRYLSAADPIYRQIIRALAYQAAKGSRTALDEFLGLILTGKGLTGTDGVVSAGARTLVSAAAPFTSLMADMRVRLRGEGNNDRICKIVSVTGADTLNLEPDGSPFWAPANLTNAVDVPFEVLPWDLFETPWKPCTVIIRLNCAPPLDATGFAYFQGGEAATSINNAQVVVSAPVRQVLGVWLASDPLRTGTNYATNNGFAGSTVNLNTALPGANTDVLVDYGAINVPGVAPTDGPPGSAEAAATAQVLAGVTIRNPGTAAEAAGYGRDPPIVRYPLYLGDRVGVIRAILDAITVAGVIPELGVKTW